MSERERPRVEVDRPRCPFCHEAVGADDAKSACGACMAWHHRACWAEHGTCSACGASDAAGAPSAAPAPEPSPSPERPVARPRAKAKAASAPSRGVVTTYDRRDSWALVGIGGGSLLFFSLLGGLARGDASEAAQSVVALSMIFGLLGAVMFAVGAHRLHRLHRVRRP